MENNVYKNLLFDHDYLHFVNIIEFDVFKADALNTYRNLKFVRQMFVHDTHFVCPISERISIVSIV